MRATHISSHISLLNNDWAHLSVLVTNGYAKPKSLVNKGFQKKSIIKVFENEQQVVRSHANFTLQIS